MEQAMTTARNPLVREIEEDIACNGESFRGSILREQYPRIRAALEAAEEMAQYAEAMEADVGCPPAVADWLKRYRAATRTEGA